jgi:signal peptidase II
VKKVHWNVIGMLGLAGIIIILDQWSKALLRSRLMMGESWSPGGWLGSIFQIVHTQNSGAAFSMGSGLSPVFTIFAIAASIGIIVYAFRLSPDDWVLSLSMGLLLGGIVGNLIDRLTIGQVTDFLSVSFFAIMNIADICITLGGAGIVIGLLYKDQQDKKQVNPEVSS